MDRNVYKVSAKAIDYIKGTSIKKGFLFYWVTFPIFKIEGKINKFFSIAIIILMFYIFLLLVPYYLITSTLLYSLGLDTNYVNLIINFSLVFLFWKINRSYQKMKISINDFILLINQKFERELNLYGFILEDALVAHYGGLGSIPSKELFVKKGNLRHKDFSDYFKYLEEEQGITISENILKSLILIHFNSDYESKNNGGDYDFGTKIIHPLFLELKRRQQKNIF